MLVAKPTNGILTIGELKEILAGYSDDTQIIMQDRKNYILNIKEVELPYNDETFAVTLIPADTFDPRQF